jgi:hypothetical protein
MKNKHCEDQNCNCRKISKKLNDIFKGLIITTDKKGKPIIKKLIK